MRYQIVVSGDGLVGRSEAAHRQGGTDLDPNTARTPLAKQRFRDLEHNPGAILGASAIDIGTYVECAVEELGQQIGGGSVELDPVEPRQSSILGGCCVITDGGVDILDCHGAWRDGRLKAFSRESPEAGIDRG